MNKRYKIIPLLAGLCIFAVEVSTAQQSADSLKQAAGAETKEAGRLLSVQQLYSTHAVSATTGETLNKTPAANLTNTLYGRLPGLTVTQGSGEPGNDDALPGIRGIGTYGYLGGANGYHTYKIFIDGFESNRNYFRNLSPSEIENIAILKDAAALATFGMRGANGIIWVTTRRGKAGKPTVQFQVRTGIQRPINIAEPLGSYSFASLYNQAISNDNGRVWSPRYSEADLQQYRNGQGVNVNWYNEVLKEQTPYSDADLIFSGGDESARYNVTLNYANQQGLYNVPKTDTTSNRIFRRYNIRANLDFKMFRIFEAKVDLSGRISENKQPNYSTSQLWNDLARYPSNIYPVKDPASGEWSGSGIYPNNPYASVNELGWTSGTNRFLQGNFELKERLDDITPGLYLSQAFSFNSYTIANYGKTSNYARFLNGSKTTTDQNTPVRATSQSPGGQEDWKQLMFTIGYKRDVKEHMFESALNYHQSDFRGDGFFATAYHYQNVSGRAHYAYRKKYIGEFGFSMFGSDAYAPGNRWGFYPAISAGWIVSEESFLHSSAVVDFLKIRASAGATASADAEGSGSPRDGQNGRYLYQQYYQMNGGAFYTGNGTPVSQGALQPLYLANPDAFAEKSMKYNLGADINLFKKLSLALDVFVDKRSGILTQDNMVPGAYGNVQIIKNLGKMTNKGFEVNAVFTDKVGKVGYSVYAMAFYNKNRIDYMAEVPTAYSYNALTGRSFGTRIGLVSTGFYQPEDFNPDGTIKSGQPIPGFGAVQPGDLRYEDLNKDNIIDQRDVTEIGNPAFPRLTYTFGGNIQFAGFDLEVLFQGAQGASVYLLDNGNMFQPFVNNGNAYPLAESAWAYYPDQGIDTRATALFPRLTTQGNNNNYRMSSFWLRSGDYLSLRNATLGYSFSSILLKNIGLSKCRLYVTAVNLATWSTLLKDYDLNPQSLNGYPAMKSFNAGVSVTF